MNSSEVRRTFLNYFMKNFVNKINPGGPGWSKFQDSERDKPWGVPKSIIAVILGCIAVYGSLLGIGQIIYGQTYSGMALLGVGGLASFRLMYRFRIL